MKRAWHFCADKGGAPVLRDGRPLAVGEYYEHEGELIMCQAGYHASERAIDALGYAPGPWACLVEVDGEVLEDSDKLVAQRRRALWCYDASSVLRAFARKQALSVIHLWTAPEVVRRYLETGDETIRAAAWDAARAAAWDAARDAARAAAWAAAWDAARAAAWDAARAAAWAAARDAARDAANTMLEEMLLDAAPAEVAR